MVRASVQRAAVSTVRAGVQKVREGQRRGGWAWCSTGRFRAQQQRRRCHTRLPKRKQQEAIAQEYAHSVTLAPWRSADDCRRSMRRAREPQASSTAAHASTGFSSAQPYRETRSRWFVLRGRPRDDAACRTCQNSEHDSSAGNGRGDTIYQHVANAYRNVPQSPGPTCNVSCTNHFAPAVGPIARRSWVMATVQFHQP